MVDMAMISGTMTALKSASDLAKLMISSHDAGVIRQKAIELQTQILAAQSNALAAQSDQFTALERIRELEKQIADLNTWDTEKKRYELKIVARGSTVYSLKEDERNSEPPHWICTTCYQQGKKSIMQSAGFVARSGEDFRTMNGNALVVIPRLELRCLPRQLGHPTIRNVTYLPYHFLLGLRNKIRLRTDTETLPMRDIDGVVTQVRTRRVPNMHALTSRARTKANPGKHNNPQLNNHC